MWTGVDTFVGRDLKWLTQDLQRVEDLVQSWCPAGAHLVPEPWTAKCPEGWTRFVCFSHLAVLAQALGDHS